MTIKRNKLVDSLGDSIGIAKAEDVIDDAQRVQVSTLVGL